MKQQLGEIVLTVGLAAAALPKGCMSIQAVPTRNLVRLLFPKMVQGMEFQKEDAIWFANEILDAAKRL